MSSLEMKPSPPAKIAAGEDKKEAAPPPDFMNHLSEEEEDRRGTKAEKTVDKLRGIVAECGDQTATEEESEAQMEMPTPNEGRHGGKSCDKEVLVDQNQAKEEPQVSLVNYTNGFGDIDLTDESSAEWQSRDELQKCDDNQKAHLLISTEPITADDMVNVAETHVENDGTFESLYWPKALLEVGTLSILPAAGDSQPEEGEDQDQGQGDISLANNHCQAQQESGEELYPDEKEDWDQDQSPEAEDEEQEPPTDPKLTYFMRGGRFQILWHISEFKSAKHSSDEQNPLNPKFWLAQQPTLIPFEDLSLHPRRGECGEFVDFDTFLRYAQSDAPERRKTAARNVSLAAMALDSANEQQVAEFFSYVEQLMDDTQCSPNASTIDAYHSTPQQTLFDQLSDLFNCLRDQQHVAAQQHSTSPNGHPTLFEQANLRLPIHLARCLLDPSCQHQIPCQQCAVHTIWAMLDESDLFTQEVIQHMIVPALFDFLDLSNEQFPQYVHGNSETEVQKTFLFQRWFRTRIEVLSIITSLLCRAHRFSRDWLIRETIPRYMAFHTEPTQMIQKKRELREVLAHSLVQIAEISGTAYADLELFPIFQRYMRDTPEVQSALLEHLADFCKVLSVDYRENLIRELSHQITMDPGDSSTWRQRVQFADQLTRLVHLFPIGQINRYLSAFALAFSADRIAEVRNYGIGMLAVVLAAFIRREWEDSGVKLELSNSHSNHSPPQSGGNYSDGEIQILNSPGDNTPSTVTLTSNGSSDESFHPPQLPLTDRLLADIRSGFWKTRNWRRRQSFARLLYSLVQDKLVSDAQFYYLFFHDLMNVSDDDVANVRQYFCLLTQLNQFEQFIGQSFHNRLERIAVEDADLENRNLAKIALGKLDPNEDGIDLKGRTNQAD